MSFRTTIVRAVICTTVYARLTMRFKLVAPIRPPNLTSHGLLLGSNQLTGPDLEGLMESFHGGSCEADKGHHALHQQRLSQAHQPVGGHSPKLPGASGPRTTSSLHFLLLLPQSSAHGYGLKPNCRCQASWERDESVKETLAASARGFGPLPCRTVSRML